MAKSLSLAIKTKSLILECQKEAKTLTSLCIFPYIFKRAAELLTILAI